MRTGTPITRNVLLALLVWTLSNTLASEARAARMLAAHISLDGKIVLETWFGDNGRPDADEVWDYLKTIKFEATKEFLGLEVKHDAKEMVLTSNAPRSRRGVVVYISYGGEAITHELTLVRVARDESGREWRLDPAQVDRLFNNHLISRSDAARLRNPRNSKR